MVYCSLVLSLLDKRCLDVQPYLGRSWRLWNRFSWSALLLSAFPQPWPVSLSQHAVLWGWRWVVVPPENLVPRSLWILGVHFKQSLGAFRCLKLSSDGAAVMVDLLELPLSMRCLHERQWVFYRHVLSIKLYFADVCRLHTCSISATLGNSRVTKKILLPWDDYTALYCWNCVPCLNDMVRYLKHTVESGCFEIRTCYPRFLNFTFVLSLLMVTVSFIWSTVVTMSW